MTCAEALESLLHAEPSDLAGQGVSPLAQHVRECARCHRLAGQVLADTHTLAATGSFSTARPQRVRRSQWVPLLVAPAVLATVIVAIAVLRPRQIATNEVTSLGPVTVSRGPGSGVGGRDLPVRKVNPRPPTHTPRPALKVQLGNAFPKPVPLAPVRLGQPSRVTVDAPVSVAQGVSVAPPPGTRAAVLHTSDPKLVVVWLY
jgi:hypothetical protein